MKSIEQIGAQGDILIARGTIPAGATAIEAKGGRLVVTHSETGHNHEMAAAGVEMLADPTDPLVCYLRVADAGALLEHMRPFDTHEPLHLPAGDWVVRRQREYVPGGWRRVED